ncbi:CvfB family protein [Roseibacillus persicicus]|uniref:GntR family transcriptional regulator n=1 Tax=Roseibacillus persicicus TaxID=454148 RepID=A0A918WN07_9BACT|nr:S1-like domain-containing RNA-binding protein [Roseibacillus persicicus]MDQ8190562.1 S1-like domain-containing RNA-binding protein [Roseibacillus persicicus]GHC61110.1 GntR family transcriptional regulator [Roseibacillus persicicus]
MNPSMAEIGERAELVVMREAPMGVFLDAGPHLGDVLLPNSDVPKGTLLGGKVDVFLYRDSEDRPIATTRMPKVMPGEFGYLEAVQSTDVGVFLDWGLPKELLLPFREQKEPCEVGRSYVVHVYVDEVTERIVASRRLSRFFSKEEPPYIEGEAVELLLYGKSDLGYKAIINNEMSGVIYHDSVFRRLHAGEKTDGYVLKVRDDGKIDLSLYPPKQYLVEELEEKLLRELEARGGFWHISDKSPAEEIYKAVGVSKKAFKRATGALYKQRKIVIGPDGISLAPR